MECLGPQFRGSSVHVCEAVQVTSLTCLSSGSVEILCKLCVSCSNNGAKPTPPCASPPFAHTPRPAPTHPHAPRAEDSQPNPPAKCRGNAARGNLARAAVCQLPYALTKLPTAAASPGSAFIISPSPSSGGNSFSPMLDFH